MFTRHPALGDGDEINVVLYQDYFKNPKSPFVTKAEISVLDNYPPKSFIGECYQDDIGQWYYIKDKDGVNLLGEIAYYQ